LIDRVIGWEITGFGYWVIAAKGGHILNNILINVLGTVDTL